MDSDAKVYTLPSAGVLLDALSVVLCEKHALAAGLTPSKGIPAAYLSCDVCESDKD